MIGRTATWLAPQTQDNHGTVRRLALLAAALGTRWGQTADGLGAGALNLAQVYLSSKRSTFSPQELDDDLVVKAESYLVEQAAGVRAAGAAPPSAAGSSSTWPPRSPTRPSTSGWSPRKVGHIPPHGCRSGLVVTGRPTCTPGSPTTSPNGCGPTWTPTPPHDVRHWVRSTRCRPPGVMGRGSWRSWRTCHIPDLGTSWHRDVGDGHARPGHDAQRDRCRDHLQR